MEAKPTVLTMVALAGTKRDLWDTKKYLEGNAKFDKIISFEMPDDHGEFPDTTGYVRQNWETLVSDKEDGSLYSYMTKCMDAAIDYTNAKVELLDKLGYKDIIGYLEWPRFGATMFAVGGVVEGWPPEITIVRHVQAPIH